MTNVLYYGDNLDILREYVKNESVDLIYLDPPFNSQATYNVLFKEASGEKSKSQIEAFTDVWHWDEETQKTYEYLISDSAVPVNLSKLINALHDFLGNNDMSAYLVMMAVRLIELHRVLKETGSLYLHCDPTASHYLKLVLDAVFGEENFRNEIIWHFIMGASAKGNFGKKHQTIFYYVKTPKAKFNLDAIRVPYNPETIARAGRGLPRYKVNPSALASQGKNPGDVWTDINPLQGNSVENLGYPTQKPEALLERIINASSNKGDVVADFFVGGGTTPTVAHRLGRRWIASDISRIAVEVTKGRILRQLKSLREG